MAELEYRRLTRSKLRSGFAVAVASRSSLWLGPDHLLVIDTSGYQETYKRFYFRDIQALTLTLTRTQVAWNWVLGALTTINLGGWALYFTSNPALNPIVILVALGMTALVAAPLVLNNAFGPTCACHLRTAVQTEQLCPLSRLRYARRIIDRLRPLILEAQAGASLQTDIPAPTAPAAGAAAPQSPAAGAENPAVAPPAAP